MVIRFFVSLYELFIDMSFYMMLGLLLVGILHFFLTRDWVIKHIGQNRSGAVVKAALFGVPLPLCSCGVIPTAVFLSKNGASIGAVSAFLISTPQTGIDSIIATYGMMGIVLAIYRPLAAFLSGVIGGLVINRLTSNGDTTITNNEAIACEAHAHSNDDSGCQGCKGTQSCSDSEIACCSEHSNDCCSDSEIACCSEHSNDCCSDSEIACCSDHNSGCCSEEQTLYDADKVAKPIKLISGILKYAYVDFLKDIAKHFVIGLIISAIISVIIPDAFFAGTFLGSGFLSMLVMIVVGIPMYICSTSSIPIALTFIAKGISPGAAFVFLFAGPVTNAASLSVLSKVLGKKVMTLYVGLVAVLAVIFGLLLDLIIEKFNLSISFAKVMGMQYSDKSLIKYVIATIFFILIVWHLITLLYAKIKAKRA